MLRSNDRSNSKREIPVSGECEHTANALLREHTREPSGKIVVRGAGKIRSNLSPDATVR